MTEMKIYVGLNDSESLSQKHETARYISVLKNVCKSYAVPFSFSVEEGGYIHEDGRYTQETSLVLKLIDVKRQTVNDIARDLCAFFHQESVLVTESPVRTYLVSETLE